MSNVVQHPRLIQETVEELRNQRTELVNECAKLSKELESLAYEVKQQRRDSQNEIQSLIQERATLRSEVEHLNATLLENKKQITLVEDRNRQFEIEMNSKQRQISKLETELASLGLQNSEVQHQLTQARSLWTDLIHNIEQDTQKLENLRNEIKGTLILKEQHEELSEKYLHLQRKFRATDQAVQDLMQQGSELRHNNAKLEAKNEEYKVEQNKLEKQIQHLWSEQRDAESKKSHALVEYDMLKRLYDQTRIDLGEEQQKYQKLQEEMQSSVTQNHSVKSRLELSQSLLRNKESELARLNADAESSKALLIELRQQISEREKRLDLLAEKMSELSVLVRTKESALSQVIHEEQSAIKHVESLKADVHGYLQQIQEHKESLVKIQNLRDQELEKLKLIKSQYSQYSSAKVQEEKRVAELTAQKFELEQQCEEIVKELVESKKLREEEAYKESILKGQVQAKLEQIKQLDDDWSRVQTELQAALSMKNEVTTQYTQLKQEIHGVEIELNQLEKQKEHKVDQLIKLEDETNSIQLNILLLQEQKQQLASELKSFENSIMLTQQEYERTSAKLKDLLQRVDDVRQQEISTQLRIQELRRSEDQLTVLLQGKHADLQELEERKCAVVSATEEREKQLAEMESHVQKAHAKHQNILAAVQADTQSLLNVRQSIRELDETRALKLHEINALKEEIQICIQKYAEQRTKQLENQSAQVRSEAERTLVTLRRRIDRALDKE